MCSLQHPADLALGMDWCGKSGALLCRQLNLEVHLQVMLTISCQLIVCFRCQSAGEYELAAIKKSSIGWGVGMVPRTQMKFLADPAWSRDQASWWPWYILNMRIPCGGSAGVTALGSSVKRVRNWKRKGPVFWRDPLGRCSCWGRGQSQEGCWGAGAVETAWAAPNSCGCALPAQFFQIVLLQRLHFLSWSTTCSGNVHSLNGQIRVIKNFRQKKMSPFCIQLPFL